MEIPNEILLYFKIFKLQKLLHTVKILKATSRLWNDITDALSNPDATPSVKVNN